MGVKYVSSRLETTISIHMMTPKTVRHIMLGIQQGFVPFQAGQAVETLDALCQHYKMSFFHIGENKKVAFGRVNADRETISLLPAHSILLGYRLAVDPTGEHGHRVYMYPNESAAASMDVKSSIGLLLSRISTTETYKAKAKALAALQDALENKRALKLRR